jgi:hypothetical protein
MTVDHIQARRIRPDLALEPGNLQTLCATCHSSAKQAHERSAGDVMAGGSSSTGWPADPGHPWNLPASASPAARLAPKRPSPGRPYRPRPKTALRG